MKKVLFVAMLAGCTPTYMNFSASGEQVAQDMKECEAKARADVVEGTPDRDWQMRKVLHACLQERGYMCQPFTCLTL